MKRQHKIFFIALIFLAVVVLFVTPLIGITEIDSGDVLIPGTDSHFILFNLRLPRVIFAFLVGAALAVAGAVFQGLFRNPLASPFTLGVLAGGSFGAALAIVTGLAAFTFLSLNNLTLFAFAGCLLDVFLVYFLAKFRGKFTVIRLLLAGVVLNFFFAALVQLLIFSADPAKNFELSRFMLGYLGVSGWTAIFDILPFVLIGIFVAFFVSFELNLFLISEEFALSKGVNVERVKLLSFIGMSLMTAAVVALSGPILFVGLMTPHIVKIFTGQHMKRVITGSIFAGGILLVICDTVARTVLTVGELPVGVVTALLGGPFFLILMMSKKSNKPSKS